MRHYGISHKENDGADSYWVLAASNEEARLFVALNGKEGSEALDPEKFTSELDDTKKPPIGLIYCRLSGPIAIQKMAADA